MKNQKLNYYLISILLLILLIIVVIPRFNCNDMGFIKKIVGKGELIYKNNEGYSKSDLSLDAYHYILITEYFRGKDVKDKIAYPYTYRPLLPYLASLLPFDPMTSINLLNLLSLCFSLIFLSRIIKLLGFSNKMQIWACLLFIFSFPTFYYGAIGNLDTTLLMFFMIGFYFILKEKWISLIFVFISGAFLKETIILLLPVAITYFLSRRFQNSHFRQNANQTTENSEFRIQNSELFDKYSFPKIIIWSVIFLIVYLSAYYIARKIIPIHNQFFWHPEIQAITTNLMRLRTYISFALTFGIPGLLSILGIIQIMKRRSNELKYIYSPMIAGISFSLCLFFYAIMSAYSDGRFVWLSYPFSIPISIYYLNNKFNKI